MSLTSFHTRIAEKSRDVSAAPVLIVAFGDSVTQGFTRANTIEPDKVYHHLLKAKLEQAYPLCTFSVINAGVAGFTATDSLPRLERDVLRHEPDLVIMAFGLNDAVVLGKSGTLLFKETFETLISNIQSHTEADLILLTPNFMVTADNPNIHPDERHYLDDLLTVQTSNVLLDYTNVIRKVAEEQNVVLVDMYQLWSDLAKEGKDTNAFLANGLNHPNAEAHTWTAQAIFGVIEEARA